MSTISLGLAHQSDPFSRLPTPTVPVVLAAIAVTVYTIGVVAMFPSGRPFVVQAGILLAIPAVMAAATIRPEWTILVLGVLPPFLIGVGLFVPFWFSVPKGKALSRSPDQESRAVRVIVPIIITTFMVRLFDNSFAIRFVGTPFLVAAGLVAGIYALERGRPLVLGRLRIS